MFCTSLGYVELNEEDCFACPLFSVANFGEIGVSTRSSEENSVNKSLLDGLHWVASRSQERIIIMETNANQQQEQEEDKQHDPALLASSRLL